MKKILLSALAGIVAFAAVALAQTIAIPTVTVINSTDLIPIIPRGQPNAQSQFASPAAITSQSGYAKYSPITGFSYTFGNTQSFIALTQGTPLTAGTITLAAAPSDGDNACLFTSSAITTLTLSANTGQTINNAVTTLAANASVCYLYSAANLTWDRNK